MNDFRTNRHRPVNARFLRVGGASQPARTHGAGPDQRSCLPAVMGILLVVSAPAAAQVTVVGEKNPDNLREFMWTVTNQTTKPIVFFEAPHFMGKLFRPPAGWIETKMTGNIGHGDKPVPGIVQAKAQSQPAAIRRGRSATFYLRIDAKGGHYAPGVVTVGFSDGSTTRLANVRCPAKPPFLQNYFPAIGLAVMFGLFLLIRAARRRRASSALQP